MKTTYFFLILAFFWSGAFGQIKEKAAIDRIFANWDKPDAPGCGLGIIQNGKLIYARGYGMANLEYSIPNSPTSVFRIGSTSKQFTAACIVRLAEQGKLKLEHSLHKFFPDFPDYAKKITVRHLLNHTSGIRDYLMLAALKGLSDDTFYTDKELMKWLVNQEELNFAPGEDFLYSNSGYWLLGQIVNKVAGMNMAQFAQQEIFKPLGMANTHFHNDHTRIVKKRASGYAPNRNGQYRISMTNLDMIGDGGIFTTIEDAKKWDDDFYNNKVLSKQFWNLMTQTGTLNNQEKIDYASGLFISTYKGLKTISHGGAFVGFRAELLRFPEQRFSVIIFTNRADANPTGMAYRVADLFLKDQYKQATTAAPKAKEKVKFIKLKNQALKKFTGHYWNDARAYSRKIYLKNDALYYYRSATSETLLRPIGSNKFKMDVQGDVVVKFDKNKKGDRLMIFVVDGNEVATSVAYTPVTYTATELKKFTGNYYSTELDIAYKLLLKDGVLKVYVNDNEEMTSLLPIKEHLFASRGLGTLEFQTDKNGTVQAFTLAAGRVKNLKFVKKP